MGTKILNDIHNDLKELIKALTPFEENEEEFRICERFCISNIKHHRYLSVDSHVTKETVNEVVTKFSIHGKYEVAKKFQELVDSFLTSFDFEHHPQYDLQWYLLTLILDLSTETNKSSLDSLKVTPEEYSVNTISGNEKKITESIDWTQYLKEGQEDFFCDYKCDSESEWSEDEEEESPESYTCTETPINSTPDVDHVIPVDASQNTLDKLSIALTKEMESRKWLSLNIQNTWWTELKWHKHPVNSRFCDAHLCDIWHFRNLKSVDTVSTLSEYQVCRELLWMFYVPVQMVVFQQKEKSNFHIRPNLSIPSLTTTAFNSILSSYCEYFSMISEIEQFGVNLYMKHSAHHKPPLTYEAYNAALKQHLNRYKTEIITIEKRVMKQDGYNTFLNLSTILKKYLNKIKILYEIHKVVVINWKNYPNWKCASTLLSSIYLEMQNSHSLEKTNICANLYLSSLTVYLNIIDTWLSEGRLEDWRNEFIIARIPQDIITENKSQNERFIVRSVNNLCSADPIMQFLIHKVQHMGHSIELLVCLDRITDMWKAYSGNHEQRTDLSAEFYTKLVSEISKYSCVELVDDTQKLSPKTSHASAKEYDVDIERNIVEQLSALDNPFLTKALEDYLPPDLCKKDLTNSTVFNISNTKPYRQNLFERLEETSKCMLPLRKILENTLSEILISHYSGASKLVKDIMTQEYKLEAHLKLMRSVYMMEAGHVMIKFYQVLFHEIESNQVWNNSYFLSCILEEIFSQQWPDSSSRWSITVNDINTHQVLQAVDNVTLHYAIGWPINIVLNKKTLEKYNEIFRFQLKLKWALWTLNNLRFSDLENLKSFHVKHKLEHFHMRRLESLRFWLLHAIGSIHAYLSGQVLQSLGFILEKALSQADSLDTIISVHDEYLSKVHEHCLLTTEFEDLMTTINNLIEMCIHVRDRWERKKLLLSSAELAVMENSYIKYHTYLALALHNAVQHKDADYCKLTPRHQITTNTLLESDVCIDFITDLSRSLLTEIAYQNFPPSGIPIPIPRMIYRKAWQLKSFCSEPLLPDEVSLNEYEQTFSYLRWYQYEENFIIFNSSSCTLHHEIKNVISDLML